MDCKHARLLLTFVRPGDSAELDAAEADELRRHLDTCAACGALAHDERRADDRIGRAMLDVTLPEGLRSRVLNRVNAEADAWLRRWVFRFASAAAVLVIAAGELPQLRSMTPIEWNKRVTTMASPPVPSKR